MKALFKSTAEPGLTLAEAPIPEPDVNDVLIKVIKTSICGTDLHIYNWDPWARRTIRPPMIIGHEFVGRVATVGSNVKGFQPGALVTGEGHLVCGHCRNCLAGRRHLCKETRGVGVNRDGAFAEYLAIPASNVWHADPSIATDIISCFDPLGNAVHTALTYDLLGEDVLITGAGPIGCMAAAVARHAGARHIVVTDINPYRLDLARKLGATEVVNPEEESIAETVRRLGMQEGFDVGLDTPGNSRALNDMIGSMFHGGKIALLGILESNTAIDWNKVIFNGLTLRGIYGRQMYETWYKMTVMIQSGLDISPLITHHFHYTEFAQAFALMRSGRSGKIILDWADDQEA